MVFATDVWTQRMMATTIIAPNYDETKKKTLRPTPWYCTHRVVQADNLVGFNEVH